MWDYKNDPEWRKMRDRNFVIFWSLVTYGFIALCCFFWVKHLFE